MVEDIVELQQQEYLQVDHQVTTKKQKLGMVQAGQRHQIYRLQELGVWDPQQVRVQLLYIQEEELQEEQQQ